MAIRHASRAVEHLRKAVLLTDGEGLADAQLLELFVTRRDQAAFAALVRRHGPLVLGVCRRVAGNEQDAEDAFQAAFLALARKAASLRQRELVGNWLYGAAYRAALEARTASARHGARERQVAEMPERAATQTDLADDWRPLLDRELSRLPDKYRVPVVLCELQGRKRKDVARQLGIPEGTLSSRLATARQMLARRLTRHGLNLSGSVLALALSQGAAAAVPAALVTATVKVAAPAAAGGALVAGVTSAKVAALADGVLKALLLAKLKAATALLAMAVMLAGTGVLAHHLAAKPVDVTQAVEPKPSAEVAREGARTDLYGDPLPEGAVARMGTVRWRLDSPAASGATFTADGKTIVTASGARTLLHCDTVTGKLLRRIPGDPALVKDGQQWDLAVAFSADGRTVAFGGRDGVVRVVDTLKGNERSRCRGHEGMVHSCALSADGRVLVTRSIDQTLRVWDAETGRQLRQMTAPTTSQPKGAVQFDSVALAPDGGTLAWKGYKDASVVHVCDVATGQERHRLEHKGQSLHRVAFSPDGRLLAATTGSVKFEGGTLSLWEVATGRLVRAIEARRHDPFYFLRFAPDGKSVITTQAESGTAVWDAATGTERWRTPIRPQEAHNTLAFSPDGKTLIIIEGDTNPTIYRFDAATGRSLATEESHERMVVTVAFVDDGKTLVTRANDGTLRWWEAGTGRPLRQVPRTVYDLAVSPDRRLLAVYREETVAVLDATTGVERWRQIAHAARAYALTFSPDGRILASRGADTSDPASYSIALWDAATGKKLRRILTGAEYLSGPVFASDGQSLLGYARGTPGAIHENSRLHWWDLATGRHTKSVAVPPGHSPFSRSPLSPDGKTLVLHKNGTPILNYVEVATGQIRFQIEPQPFSSPHGFSPNGRLLFTGGGDNAIRAWDVFSGRLLLDKGGHNGNFIAVAFSPDGRRLATGSRDTTALIWDWTELLPDRRPKPLALTRDELESLWADLAGDAAKAYQAIGRLVASSSAAVGFLGERLRTPAAAPPPGVEQLVADLDSADFTMRQRAARELEKLGESAAPALRKVLTSRPSAEVRRRVEEILEKLAPTWPPQQLRVLRAIEVLEHIGSAEARRVLRAVAEGIPEARLTQEAKASLDRLSRRAGGP